MPQSEDDGGDTLRRRFSASSRDEAEGDGVRSSVKKRLEHTHTFGRFMTDADVLRCAHIFSSSSYLRCPVIYGLPDIALSRSWTSEGNFLHSRRFPCSFQHQQVPMRGGISVVGGESYT